MAEGEEWNVKFGAWTSRQLDGNTWLNHTTVEIKVNETIIQYLALIYARYINESHRLYVLTLAQMGDGGYSQAFTWANYWFKNKTVYFGDWVVVGNTTLSSYFAAASRAVDALAKASDKQYKPQAYPQISQALMEMSRATAGTDIDKPLGRGYALVTDVPVVGVAFFAFGIADAVYSAVRVYRETGNWAYASFCGVMNGMFTAFGSIPSLAGIGGWAARFYSGMWMSFKFSTGWAARCPGIIDLIRGW